MTTTNVTVGPLELPPSLNLPAHLSAHKYFFVCTLTVAAWDSLVLSPRTWRLFKAEGWPALKSLFFFLRFFMPAEFIIVGVAFFDTHFSQAMCQRFYLFEPIATAVLLAACSTVHVIRVYAIHDHNRKVLFAMSVLLAAQIVVTGVCCAFYRSVPLQDGQGCIAGPRSNWVGVYWLSATVLYTASLFFGVWRSVQSLKDKPISLWKLMLRDGLNLYASIWIVNMVNMLFWFIVQPESTSDSIKTTVTSMAAVLTTTMTLRIILTVRGTLVKGGNFTGVWSSSSGSQAGSRSRGQAGVVPGAGANSINISPAAPTYMIGGLGGINKQNGGWNEPTSPVKAFESKEVDGLKQPGVQVTVQREINGARRV